MGERLTIDKQNENKVTDHKVERWTPKVVGQFGKPYRWKKPRRVIISMVSDPFDASISADFVWQMITQVIAKTPEHIYQVTTKQPGRMVEVLKDAFLPKNLWIGVHVETQHDADRRVPLLLQINAAVRFVSCEPLTQFVDLVPWLAPLDHCYNCDVDCPDCPCNKAVFLDEDFDERTGCQPARTINWVVVSGEIGAAARPMHPEWVRSIRDQCQTAKVPFCFERWGTYTPYYDGSTFYTNVNSGIAMDQPCPMYRVGMKSAGRELDGTVWEEVPEQVKDEDLRRKHLMDHYEVHSVIKND